MSFTASKPSPPNPENNNNFSLFDYVFIIVIGLLLCTGIQLTKVDNKPAPFGVSMLFGSAASLITYYFLGGINKDEASIEAGLGDSAKITLGGSIAALMGATLLSNHFLSQQMTTITLEHQPPDGSLLLIDQNANSVKEIKIEASFGGRKKVEKLTANEDNIKEIVQKCIEHKGFCQPLEEEVKFEINPSLVGNQANVCRQKTSEWLGKELMIYPQTHQSNLESVNAREASKLCLYSDINIIEISQEIANKIDVIDQEIGFASIAQKYALIPTSRK